MLRSPPAVDRATVKSIRVRGNAAGDPCHPVLPRGGVLPMQGSNPLASMQGGQTSTRGRTVRPAVSQGTTVSPSAAPVAVWVLLGFRRHATLVPPVSHPGAR